MAVTAAASVVVAAAVAAATATAAAGSLVLAPCCADGVVSLVPEAAAVSQRDVVEQSIRPRRRRAYSRVYSREPLRCPR